MVAANWVTDFNIRTRSGGIHRGFADGVEGIWPALLAALEGTDKRIFLAGHSLGGALAVVAAWRLTGDTPEAADRGSHGEEIDVGRIAGVLTFGMPRAGDEAFEAAYRSRGLWQKTARLEYGSDIIPSLPPAVSGQLAFRHVGPALHCPHGGQFKDVLPPRDDPDDRIELEQLEERLGISDTETLRSVRDAWGRILDHGVPRSPAGGTATLIIDRAAVLPSGSFAGLLPGSARLVPSTGLTEARVSISADDADTFARASEAHIEERGGGFSALLRRLLPGG